MKTYKRVSVTLMLAAAVAACHSSRNDTPSPAQTMPPPTPAVTAEVPASASSTVMDFINYLKSLIDAAADTLEPVDVSKVTPKTDDTAEPTPVN